MTEQDEITVRDLIAILQEIPPDLPVYAYASEEAMLPIRGGGVELCEELRFPRGRSIPRCVEIGGH